MDEPAVVRLSALEARRLTEAVKADAAALWAKLLSLYEGGAHTALGYSSWGAYYEAEFGQTPSRGYQLLRLAKLDEALVVAEAESLRLPGVPVVHSPPNERQARELLRIADPAIRARVWQEVNASGEPVTAKVITEAVAKMLSAPTPPRAAAPPPTTMRSRSPAPRVAERRVPRAVGEEAIDESGDVTTTFRFCPTC